jgi:hypothetical protein
MVPSAEPVPAIVNISVEWDKIGVLKNEMTKTRTKKQKA